VVTGDVTQVDLPTPAGSGLREVQQVLAGLDDVAFCILTSADVVRHRLVSDIIDAYAAAESRRWAAAAQAAPGPRPGPGSGRMAP